MKKRVRTKIGDVFCVALDIDTKKYFQYVANDDSQLGSEVVRVFKKVYDNSDTPDLEDIIKDGIDFYAHIVIRLGMEMGLWDKAGHAIDVGGSRILFRDTNDYGTKKGEEQLRRSERWYVWEVNGDRQYVGSLKGEHKNAFVGLVLSPQGFLALLKGQKYPPLYPE